MIERICQICGKKFLTWPKEIRKGKAKFCSYVCYGKYRSKTFLGSKNFGWKGNDVGKLALHDWIEKKRGLAKFHKCQLKDDTCKGRIEWSNKSGKYKRELNDWWTLCLKHHRNYDFTEEMKIRLLKTSFKKGNIPWNKKADKKKKIKSKKYARRNNQTNYGNSFQRHPQEIGDNQQKELDDLRGDHRRGNFLDF